MNSITKIDPRLTRLSHSGRTTLHRCPRKYQLQKIASTPHDRENNVTLAFGTTVGLGIQCVLENKPPNDVIMEMLLSWNLPDLYDEESKTSKSFFYALFAVQSFSSIRNGPLDEYNLAYFKGKPAVELSFRIALPYDFTYRGFVDVVLQHKTTGKYLVLEVKTTGAKVVTEATYKNSGQALGYSLILDAIAPGQSEYEMWYLVYLSSAQRYELLTFKKHYSDRAFWIKELIMDVETVIFYEKQGRYPSHGESCYDFFRVCSFYSICTMSTATLELPYNAAEDKELTAEYMLELSLLDIINAQLLREEI